MKKDEHNRRRFINNALLLTSAAIALPAGTLQAAEQKQTAISPNLKIRPKVLIFDVNETLLDLHLMNQTVAAALNGKKELLALWFTTMLQYSLVATVGNHYEDFGAIGAATLIMVAKNNGINLTETQAKAAIQPILSLQPHPEVKTALTQLNKAGFKLVSLTNSSNKSVAIQFKNAGIDELFEQSLSVEDIGKYKPHINVYIWAARKIGVQASECMLIAAHGWEIAGAQWAGWRTAFIARPGQQLYPLAALPEIDALDLSALATQLISME